MLPAIPTENTCTDCHVAPEITYQCTDQCIVVACTANEQQAPACSEVSCAGDHCQVVCEDGECDGLDEFLQCCTDFHAYYEEPRHNPDARWAWDPCLKTFMCSCEAGSHSEAHTPHGAMHTHIDEPSDTSTRSSPISSTPSSQADLDNMLTSACMWGDCADRFNGPLDLAEHVNVAHLPGKTHYDPPAMACQWKDCSVYPTPYSMPGPSSGDFDTFFGLLSSHLLHDHLGLGYVPECGEHHHHSESSVEETAPAPTAAVAEHVCRWALCGESFTSSDDLTQHLANAHVGSGKMAYDCFWGDCSRHGDNGFTSKQKLSRHLQSHTKHRPFQCQICMQHFSEAATLQQHMRRHTLERPFVCDHPGCGKSFAIAGALTIHKRTHNGERPFKCPQCDRHFAESSNLSKHLRTHTGERPHKCTEPGCIKSFARADQLTRHKRVHRKVDN